MAVFIFTDVPSSPRDLHSTEVTQDSVTLSWLAPADNGGSEVTHYVIEKRDALRMAWQMAGTSESTKFTVPRLSEGVQYVFRVRAENSQGQGMPEELMRSIAPRGPYCK
jgi:titin